MVQDEINEEVKRHCPEASTNDSYKVLSPEHFNTGESGVSSSISRSENKTIVEMEKQLTQLESLLTEQKSKKQD